ncbi:biofilm regulation protein phosphatase SiaA [Crenobacter sp. SG2305]|uniref:biofilm regulation protein phosphatase SiaA n=1 Tax=Crenobacter oryzisoli TaxID=3056844 RepID=UPI0025AA41D9|nr:biofilm regulation protein phosphatase SiaA [Crenobacter sp. SG2305]MDN0085687.1 biofilm regulation protein phosphatase SiaA [Crenobacter sp. SG2305]
MSLRWKSALSLTLLFILILVVMLVGSGLVLDRIRDHDAAEFVRTHSLLQKQKLVTLLTRELAISQRMANLGVTYDWLKDENNPAKRQAFFREAEGFRSSMSDHVYFIVVDRSHHYYFSDGKNSSTTISIPRYTLSPAIPKDGWYFATRKAGQDYALDVNVDDKLKVTKVWFNVMIREGSQILGLAGAAIDLSRFLTDFIHSADAGITNIIINGDGVIQAHPDTRLIEYAAVAKAGSTKTLYRLLTAQDSKALMAAMSALKHAPEEGRQLEVSLQGKPRQLGVSYIPELNWYVISAIDPNAVSVLDQHLIATMLTVGLAFLAILGLVVTVGIDRLILTPLSRLHRSVAQISSGDYRIQLSSGRNDELGDLTRAFSHMAGEIHSHTEQLEQRIEERTHELASAHQQLVAAHRAIQDSIRYASLIQGSILPHEQLTNELGDDHFLLWKPRDVVGGDFYVFRASEGTCLLGVVDCAGHGVPGAFMTMIAQTAFNVAVSELGPSDPASLLERMDKLVRAMLHQDTSTKHIATSMDAGLCAIDFVSGKLTFAGSRLSLYWSDGQQCEELAGERCGIADRKPGKFRNQSLTLDPAATYYLTTDGFLDQAGGEKGFGFGRQRFTELLNNHARLPMQEQREAFLQRLADYQGTRAQRDDITVLSFRFGSRRSANAFKHAVESTS